MPRQTYNVIVQIMGRDSGSTFSQSHLFRHTKIIMMCFRIFICKNINKMKFMIGSILIFVLLAIIFPHPVLAGKKKQIRYPTKKAPVYRPSKETYVSKPVYVQTYSKKSHQPTYSKKGGY
jgi:hypothetical protein